MTRLWTVALGVVLVPVGAWAQTAPAPARPRPATPRVAPARPRAGAPGSAPRAGDVAAPAGTAGGASAVPVPVPNNAPESDLTIAITAEPPAQPAPPDAGDNDEDSPAVAENPYVRGAYGPQDYRYGSAYGPQLTPTVPAPPPDTPAMIASSWRRHLAFGASVGVASPLGVLGAWVDVNFVKWVGVTAGFGTGGSFGPAIALGVNVRPLVFGRFALYAGLGFSTNFVWSPDQPVGLDTPNNSWWINPELGFEWRARNNFFLRLGAGWCAMLNTGDFRNVDTFGMYGPNLATHPMSRLPDPIAAADAHDRGQAVHFPFIHLDLGYLTPL